MTSRDAAEYRATIAYLRACRAARAAGYPVAYTTDPEWLVDMAINRRAGWPDDPGPSRGSCMPVAGRYPKRADGDHLRHLTQLAARINMPRLRVYAREAGADRAWLVARLPHRFADRTEESAA